MSACINGRVPDDARSAAAYYLNSGYLPVPVPRVGRCKAPVHDAWQDLRPTPADLETLFPTDQILNLGLLLGEPSGGLIDIDLDIHEAMAAAPFLLPETGWISGRAGKRHSHWWYLVSDPPDQASEAFTDVNADKTVLLEVRSTRGQTVVPPGRHETGEEIVWHTFTEPARTDRRELDAAARAVAAVALLARHWPGKSSRQFAFLHLSGGLLRGGWSEEQAQRFLEALAAVTGDEEARKRAQTVAQTARKMEQDKKTTGWPKLECVLGPDGKEVVRSVRQWLGFAPEEGPPKKVRTLEPYQPFPVEALPAPIAEYVRQGALALGCDAAFLALPALAVVASVIGNTRTLRLKRGWEEPCIVWSAVVADSGTLKSPAYLKVMGYVFRLQNRLLTEFKVKAAQYQDDLLAHKESKRKAKEEGTDPGEPPEPPVLLRVVCSDTTIEKLAEILQDNARGTLVARDELAGWLGSFTRYKGKQGNTDLPNWLEMFRAGTVIVDRKTTERKTLFIPRAAVSVTGGIQPGVLARALTPEFLDAGLAARLLMAKPPKLRKHWTEAEVDPDAERAYHDALDKLLALDFDTHEGEKVPYALKLSKEAKEAWVAFYNAWAQEQAAAEGELAAAFSKLEAYAARFALLHHVVTCTWLDVDDRREVGVKSIEAGATLCRWFAREARRIYMTLSESDDERDTRRLVEFIQVRGGRITVKGLQRSNSRKYPTSEAAEQALSRLVDAGLADWQPRPASAKGGKPTRDCVLRPLPTTDDTDDTSDDPEEGGGGLPTIPPDDTPPGPQNPGVSGGIVGIVGSRNEGEDLSGQAGSRDGLSWPSGVSSDGIVGRVPHQSSTFRLQASGKMAPPFLFVRDGAGLETVRMAVQDTDLVALDLVTTGLDCRADRSRLLSLVVDTVDGGTFAYVIDCFAVDPSPLREALAPKELVLHNGAFDLGFLARLGFIPSGRVHDTMLQAQLLTAGTNEKLSLSACCQRWLGRTVGKAQQRSDWSDELTAEQLAYAVLDVEVLRPLHEVLSKQIQEAGLTRAAEIEQRCLPAVVSMAHHGVALDRDSWRALAQAADEEAQQARAELDAAAPADPERMFSSWNWDSTQQAQKAMTLAGCRLPDTSEATLAGVDHPLAQLLRRYRLARKRVGTYGNDWLEHVQDDGRVYAHWRQMGAASGRMSCSTPNLQQLPRGDHRRCVAAPPGRVLVWADYSQVELRIAARVSGDEALTDAYRKGEDLHVLTARKVLGIREVTKEDRQTAKALNFGLLYGMGVKGFRVYARAQYGLNLSEGDARRYRNGFFRTYPGLAAWHQSVRARKAAETRTLAGRRRLLNDKTPDTQRLNTPVQGTGSDGLKLALALLWERREEVPGAFPVLAVHDEIVVECGQDQAEAVAAWLKKAMADAMAPLIDPVPVEVEVKVGRTWGA